MNNLTKHTILTIFLALIGLVSVMGAERADAKNRSIVGVWMMESETAPSRLHLCFARTRVPSAASASASTRRFLIKKAAARTGMSLSSHYETVTISLQTICKPFS